MITTSCTMLTIITESSLEKRLVADLKRLGAPGYTVCDAHGEGHRGVRNSGWQASGNIRVEVICDEATVATIAEQIRDRYYSDYAMILYLSEVRVLRPEKFRAKPTA